MFSLQLIFCFHFIRLLSYRSPCEWSNELVLGLKLGHLGEEMPQHKLPIFKTKSKNLSSQLTKEQ